MDGLTRQAKLSSQPIYLPNAQPAWHFDFSGTSNFVNKCVKLLFNDMFFLCVLIANKLLIIIYTIVIKCMFYLSGKTGNLFLQ